MVSKVWKPTRRQGDFISIPDTIFEAFFGGAAGPGKGCKLDTPVLTSQGWKKLVDVHPGDLVYSTDGFLEEVVAESRINNLDCYKVTFDTGDEVICDSEHFWLTLSYKERESRRRRSEGFRANRNSKRQSHATYTQGHTKSEAIAKQNKSRIHEYLEPDKPSKRGIVEIYESQYHQDRVNHSVNLTSLYGLDCGHIDLPIAPYVLGAWLGDGSSYNGGITVHPDDLFVVTRIQCSGYDVVPRSDPRGMNWGILGLGLGRLGLVTNKHIPMTYFLADHHSRLELLQGLMDTDGTATRDGGCEISLSNPKLAEDVYSLICSLGIKANKSVCASALYGIPKKDRTRINFTSSIPVFSLPRKLEKQSLSVNSRASIRYITSVEKVDSVPTKCIQVNGGTFLIGRALIPTCNSECLMMIPILREFYKHPRFKGILFRRTYPELEREIILRSHDYYPSTGAVYSDSKKRWTWPAYGSVMQFGYAEHEKDVRNYDTAEYQYMAFDELTSFTRFQYEYLAFSRCRSSIPDLPAIVRTASNPGNVGHGFVRDRFVAPARLGYTIIRETVTVKGEDKILSRIFIPAKATDNPHIDPNYIVRLQLLPEAERLAKAEGDWWTFSGQVFDDWRLMPYSDEPSNACHVIPPFAIPQWWPRILAIDWGYSAMMCALWGAIDPGTHRLYIYREYTAIKTKISSWATTVAHLSQGENLADVVLDPSAWGNRGDEFTIAEQFEQYSGLRPRPADNNRIAGKLLVQDMLRWTPLPRDATASLASLDLANIRISDSGLSSRYVNTSMVDQTAESNLPQLQIFDTCEELKRAIPLCIYNDPTTSKRGSPEDVAEFNGDDPYDTLRYICKASRYYLETGERKNEEQAQIARAITNLERTGNQTDFHIQMDSIDRRYSRSEKPVKKYHSFTGFRQDIRRPQRYLS